MKVLIACEYSGIVRDAFRAHGHDAWSCDLLQTESPETRYHYIGDVFNIINTGGWDLMIAHPPCTYLSVSGLHWNKRKPDRLRKTEDAINFVWKLWDSKISKICIENPVGCLSTLGGLAKPDQIIQPYNFGEDASKKTCLWLRGLPLLEPTEYYPPRIVNGKNRWGNQTDSGQNKLGPSEHRWKDRSRTYKGIAEAMATQWG